MAAYDPYDWLIPASQNPYKLKYRTRHIDLASESERQEVERFNAPLEAEQKRLENALEKASQPFREKLSICDPSRACRVPLAASFGLFDKNCC